MIPNLSVQPQPSLRVPVVRGSAPVFGPHQGVNTFGIEMVQGSTPLSGPLIVLGERRGGTGSELEANLKCRCRVTLDVPAKVARRDLMTSRIDLHWGAENQAQIDPPLCDTCQIILTARFYDSGGMPITMPNAEKDGSVEYANKIRPSPGTFDWNSSPMGALSPEVALVGDVEGWNKIDAGGQIEFTAKITCWDRATGRINCSDQTTATLMVT